MPSIDTMPSKIHRNALIIEDRLAGATYKEIAAKYNIDQSNVCRILNRDECREVIEQGLQEQIALIPKAIDNYKNKLLVSDDQAIMLKASQDILRNTGLSPSNSPVIAITNILNLHSQDIHLEAAAAKALKHLGLEIPSDVIDVEPSPVSEATP